MDVHTTFVINSSGTIVFAKTSQIRYVAMPTLIVAVRQALIP
jgi:hypothetical protein